MARWQGNLNNVYSFIKVIGLKIKCMVEANILGKMVNHMMVNMRMIKNVDLVYLNGLMENNIKEIGQMVNNMEKV